VLTDVSLETQSLDPASVERALSEETRAIMVVHYAGKPADMDGLLSFGLPIVEDAAHAIDSELDGRRCGTIGEVGIYSFDSVKNLATPDGGGVTSPHEHVLETVRQLRYCGIGRSGYAASSTSSRWWETTIADAFPRALPNDVSASVGLAQLDKLAANQARRREIWHVYQPELGLLEWLRTPVDAGESERHSYFTYLIRVQDGRRDLLAKTLLAAGIYTTLRYHPLHLSDVYRSDRPLPNCERLAEEGLNLPLHPRMSDEDVATVIDAVSSF
jgi:aminotransferase